MNERIRPLLGVALMAALVVVVAAAYTYLTDSGYVVESVLNFFSTLALFALVGAVALIAWRLIRD